MNRGAPENGTNTAFLAATVDGSEVNSLGLARSAGEANDLLASAIADGTPTGWLILVPTDLADAEDPAPAPELSTGLRAALDAADTNAAMVAVHPETGPGPAPAVGAPPIRGASATARSGSVRELAALLRRHASAAEAERPLDTAVGGMGPAVVVRPDRVLAVGGFDPAAAGLGLADLATRLRENGQAVIGVPDDPLAMQNLEPQLTLRERLGATADWHRRHGDDGDFDSYRRRVIAATSLARVKRTRSTAVDGVRHDARQGWPGPRPDQAQQGVGQRADWRFLLPDRPVAHLLLTGAAADEGAEEPHFLEADGWADRVSLGSPGRDVTAPPDVVVIGRGVSVARALADASADCTVVLELDRNPLGRFRRVQALRSAGFHQAAQYLVTPDLDRAKRYISLDQPSAIGWLLAPPPPVAGTARGLRRTAHRLLINTMSRAVATAASLPVVSAIAGSGTQGLIIATREPVFEPPSVLMTSGHDEGSRAVLVSLGGDGPSRTVTKMSPRPRYNQNAEAEAEVIRSVMATINSSEPDQAGSLLPTIKPPVAARGLRGAQESYAGRWTATDLCNRVPASRGPVLAEVLEAIDTFSLATRSATEPWSNHLFQRFLGDLFDRYGQLVGDRRSLTELRAALLQRSSELAGTPIPLVQRHYDLGPWNVVYADDASELTIIDWELAPPRTLGDAGLGGADQLYFAKYWLHIALETGSIEDELQAFAFLDGAPQAAAAQALDASLQRLGIDRRFVPLLAVHLWLETALYTATRRAEHGGDPGSAVRYLELLAARRAELLQFWS